MFCKNCGANLSYEDKFCTSCGKPVDEKLNNNTLNFETTQEIESPFNQGQFQEFDASTSKEKIPKSKIIIFIVTAIIVILMLIAAILGISYLASPERKIIKSIDNEDYNTAASIYKENYVYGDNDTEDIEKAISEKLEEIKQSFIDKEIDYTTATTKIAALISFNNKNITDKCAETRSFVNKLNASRTAFENAKQLADAKNYPDAITKYKQVIQEDSNYETAQQEIINLINTYKSEIIKKAQQYADSKDYENAISTLKSVLEFAENDTEIEQKITEYENSYVNKISAEADTLASENKFKEALSILTDATNIAKSNSLLTKKIDEVKNSYVDHVISESDKLVSNKDYNGATNLINDALKIVTENQTLIKKLDEIENMKPVKLSSIHVIDSGWYEKIDDVFTDSYGNNYDGALLFSATDSAYAYYNLNKEYTTLTGSIVSTKKSFDNKNMSISFYDDNDNLLYTVTDYEKTTGKIDFSIDVKNITKLTVKTTGKYSSIESAHICLVNAQLSK